LMVDTKYVIGVVVKCGRVTDPPLRNALFYSHEQNAITNHMTTTTLLMRLAFQQQSFRELAVHIELEVDGQAFLRLPVEEQRPAAQDDASRAEIRDGL